MSLARLACRRVLAVRRAPILWLERRTVTWNCFIALDVLLASTALCALDAHGKVVKEAKIDNESEALIA